MQHRTLGNTGWSVSVIGLGSWGLGGQWGPVEQADAVATLRAAYDAGVNFFDTADAYGDPPGLSEHLIALALHDVRDRVLIASKVGNWARRMGHPLPYTDALHVELCCDASLHRLKTDCIDLYQNHIGNTEQIDVFLEAFDRLIHKGKIRAFGVSTGSVDTAAAFHQAGRLAAVQLDYSFLNRAPEHDLLPWCLEHRVGVIVRGPLAMGVATGKFTPDTRFADSVRQGWNQGPSHDKFLQRLAIVEKLRSLDRPDRSLSQAALQFVLAHPAVTVAIPGAKSPAQARANAAAGRDPLPPHDLSLIQTASA